MRRKGVRNKMADIDIRGDIITNDDKWIYDWFGWDSTSPNDVRGALSSLGKGETLTVQINSGGGSVMAGQEIYSILHGRDDVVIEIQSMAGSAASVIAMANRSTISPVAMIMIHNVSMSNASGDYHDMQKNAEILKQMNAALSAAYASKTGMGEEEILKLMDRETWITANQALEMGFVDEIKSDFVMLTNSTGSMRLTEELRNKAMTEKRAAEELEAEKEALLHDLDLLGI